MGATMRRAIACGLGLSIVLGVGLELAQGEPPFRADAQDTFGVYSSLIDGSDLKLMISDPKREMNHVRISPDHRHVTFTRYNHRGWFDRFAREEGGYSETEILVGDYDGANIKNLRSLFPPRKGIAVANGYWTPDGQAILFVTNDNPEKLPQIMRYDMKTGISTRMPTPPGLSVADPHAVGDLLVFPARQGPLSVLWTMHFDGAGARQLTHPSFAANPKGVEPPLGDHDPKLSPDGKTVAVMRHAGPGADWHVVLVDVTTGKERDRSTSPAVDAVPEWSGDGKLLIFWHVDRADLQRSGLYTMRPDGGDRKRVPLPHGYFYTMPAFLPGSGSGTDARIVFSAKRQPQM